MSVTITPSSASNKIFFTLFIPSVSGDQNVYVTVKRGSTVLGDASQGFMEANGRSVSVSYLDSPATTSATTYQMYMKVTSGSAGYGMYASGYLATLTCMEIKG